MVQLRHQWLQDGLQDQGITQRQVAEKWGVSPGAISKFLKTGEGVNMTYSRVEDIAGWMKMTPKEANTRLEELSFAPIQTPVSTGTGPSQVDRYSTLDNSATVALENLTKAVETARAAFAPLGYKVRCIIEREL
jgi:transcriptional regulator with XRE-family HTH domain